MRNANDDAGSTVGTVDPLKTGLVTVGGGYLTPTQVQSMIDASLAANPNASGGGYEGVGTPSNPGPDGSTNYGTSTSPYTDPSGTGPGGPGQPPLDWKAYLADWGFDDATIKELDRIFRTYDADHVSQAQAAALAYIRQTPWYAQHFAGIQAGISKGVITDEQDYRSYVNDLDQTYQRYFGRSVGTDEVAAFLNRGWNAKMVGGHFAGQAAVTAQRGDLSQLLGSQDTTGDFTQNEYDQYGDQLGGLDNALGPGLQQRIDKARARFQALVQGSLATPAFSLLGGKPVATSLGRDITKPDIGS